MSDAPDNSLRICIRRLDAKLDTAVDVLADHGRRLTSLEIAVANLAATAARSSHYANMALRVDRVRCERPPSTPWE